MLFCDAPAIRDVLLFPQMKPETVTRADIEAQVGGVMTDNAAASLDEIAAGSEASASSTAEPAPAAKPEPEPAVEPEPVPATAAAEFSRAATDAIEADMVSDLRDRLIANGMSIDLTDAARSLVAKEGADPIYGARPLRRAIQTLIEDPLSEELLAGDWKAGDIVEVDVRDGKIVFTKTQGEIPAPRKRDHMLRRAALLNGDADWTSITTSSIPSSGGLPWSFSIATPSASYVVGHGSISGTDEEKTAQLMGILEESPAGIVLYAGDCSSPHAVLLLGCKDGTFYAHDSLTGATSALDECVTVRVSNASSYWYVSSGVLSPDPVSIAGATVSVSSSGTGPKDAAGAAVSVTLGSASLVEGTDFTVSYESSVNVGMATVTVTGMGGRLALVMGSEGSGISRLVLERCDFSCRLPQRGRVESLNVAQAATVLCYEWLRRECQGSEDAQ